MQVGIVTLFAWPGSSLLLHAVQSVCPGHHVADMNSVTLWGLRM